MRTYLKKINVPILFLAAGEEEIIDNSALKYVVQHLPKCSVKIYEHSRHQIFMETDEILKQFWTDYDLFIEQNFGEFEQALAKRRLIEPSKFSRMKRRNTTFTNDANSFQPNY